MSARSVLREVFGHESFRPGQERAIEALLSGRDVQVLLPTGGGKSLCYQVPAVVAARQGRGPTLVISPLIALMEDQVTSLRRRGVACEMLHSALPTDERRALFDRARRAAVFYVSPERVALAGFRRWLARTDVPFVAIDEAHCVAEWGHDFRPEYRHLGVLRELLGVPTIALTATATPAAMADVRTSLGLRDPVVVQGSFRRPNLHFSVELHEGDRARTDRLIELLEAEGLGRDPERGRVVVYAATRKRVKDVAELLRKSGFRAGWYHAGRTDNARARAQEAFEQGRHAVLVATTAFGMGIDQPDVRLVVHVQAPGSLEAWYQQAGRAGRDGLPARAVLLYGPGDAVTQARIRGDQPHPGAVEGWKALQAFVYGSDCRQRAIERWFGAEAGEPCGHCDACDAPGAVEEAVVTARDRLAARRRVRIERARAEAAVSLDASQRDLVVAFVDALPKPLGKTLVAAGLRGGRSQRARRARVDQNPHFGALTGVPERAIVTAIDELLEEGRLVRRGRKYPTVWIPEKRIRPRTTTPRRPAVVGLAAALRAFRTREARRRRWRAYQVFTNATLDALVERRPTTLSELGEVPGIGPKRLERFGEALLELVRSA